jgi:hypothetical protein
LSDFPWSGVASEADEDLFTLDALVFGHGVGKLRQRAGDGIDLPAADDTFRCSGRSEWRERGFLVAAEFAAGVQRCRTLRASLRFDRADVEAVADQRTQRAIPGDVADAASVQFGEHSSLLCLNPPFLGFKFDGGGDEYVSVGTPPRGGCRCGCAVEGHI